MLASWQRSVVSTVIFLCCHCDGFVAQALYKRIDDFSAVLPLLQELSKPSLRDRHWEAIASVTGTPLPVSDSSFTLAQLLAAPLVEHHDAIEEECDTADKQQAIELKLADLQQRWTTERFAFVEWKARDVPVLQGVLGVVEELEEAQMQVRHLAMMRRQHRRMLPLLQCLVAQHFPVSHASVLLLCSATLQLQTVLASRAIAPFKEPAAELLKTLSDTSDILELWCVVVVLRRAWQHGSAAFAISCTYMPHRCFLVLQAEGAAAVGVAGERVPRWRHCPPDASRRVPLPEGRQGVGTPDALRSRARLCG